MQMECASRSLSLLTLSPVVLDHSHPLSCTGILVQAPVSSRTKMVAAMPAYSTISSIPAVVCSDNDVHVLSVSPSASRPIVLVKVNAGAALESCAGVR